MPRLRCAGLKSRRALRAAAANRRLAAAQRAHGERAEHGAELELRHAAVEHAGEQSLGGPFVELAVGAVGAGKGTQNSRDGHVAPAMG
jgi:hypothetical protein